MATYTFAIPRFHINQIRSAHSDTLFASTGMKVMNATGGLHHDWGSQVQSLGDHHQGDDVVDQLVWANIDVPDPTPENPDGGAVYWSYLLVNNGHTQNGWTDVLGKAADAFAGALADKAIGGSGVSLSALAGLAAVLGIEELVNLLTADCDGTVAVGAFAYTATQLATMVGEPGDTADTTQDNPGTNSPAGCGANSDYQVEYIVQRPPLHASFQALDLNNVLVLGSNRNLWLEKAPFNHVPPARVQVDGNVQDFRALNANQIYTLGTDANLWLEQGPFGRVPPKRVKVDGDVQSFQPLDSNTALILGIDGNLWLSEGPWGNVPPTRQQVDGNVRAFQALSSEAVLVLGRDRNLWLETAPFGHVPPARIQVDGNVLAFHAFDDSNIIVLGTDRKLWFEHAPFGHVPPKREEIDANVQTARALAIYGLLWVLGTDGKLWLEKVPFGTPPPGRQQIDGNVRDYQPIDLSHVVVLGTDGNLWLEQGPFGRVPPARAQIDGNVARPDQ